MTREDDEKNPYYRRMMDGPVGRFGAYLMAKSFDEAMWTATSTLEGKSKAPSHMALTERLKALTEDEQDAVVSLVRGSVVSSLHGFLHGLSNDESLIKLVFEGANISESSDGFQGDLFFWLRDLSKYPYDALSESDG